MSKLQRDVEKLKKDGAKFDTYNLAKSHNIGRIIIAIFIVLFILSIIWFNL